MNPRDPILWAAFALFGGAASAVSPGPSVLALVLIACVLRWLARVRWWVLALVVASFAIGAIRGRARLQHAEALYDRAVSVLPAPSRCFGTGTVTSSPIVRGSVVQADVELDEASCNDVELQAPMRIRIHGAPEELGRGDRVEVAATIAPVYLFRNAGTGDGLPAIARSGVAASGGAEDVHVLSSGAGLARLVDRARTHVRRRITASYHPDAEALGRALVLGETDLAAGDDAAFRVTGLSHLLAVSGTHLVIVVLGFTAALRALLLRVPAFAERTHVDRWVAILGIPVAWVYADFAGGGGSVIRAAAMLTAAMLARALGRRASSGRTFAFALAFGAVVDPLAIFDVSFTLSAGATLGLLGLSHPLVRVLGGSVSAGASLVRRGWALLARALGTTLGASLACAPILATMAPTLPIIGLVANVVAAPLGEVFALPLCFAHAALTFSPTLERGAAFVTSGALLGVLEVARLGAATGLVVAIPPPTAWEIAVLVGSAAAFALAPRFRSRLAIGIAAIALLSGLELRARSELRPLHRLRISALDVGQGDSILVDLPDGKVMLIDGGGLVGSPVDTGARVVLPALRARRRSRIDVAVLSHPHPDHFTGLVATLDALEVGELWETGEAEHRGGGPDGVKHIVDGARRRGIPIRRPSDLCGRPRDFGGATVEVLAPCPGVRDERGANDNSFVIRIAFGRRAALMTGDAESEAEASLVALDPSRLAADLLKVGHHGSRTSTTPAFLSAVSPRAAIISCGVRNRFGHPHVETLQKLTAAGTQILRTDRGGEWRWETDGDTVTLARAVE